MENYSWANHARSPHRNRNDSKATQPTNIEEAECETWVQFDRCATGRGATNRDVTFATLTKWQDGVASCATATNVSIQRFKKGTHARRSRHTSLASCAPTSAWVTMIELATSPGSPPQHKRAESHPHMRCRLNGVRLRGRLVGASA